MIRALAGQYAAMQQNTLAVALTQFFEDIEMHSKELILEGFADYVVHLITESEDHSYMLTDLW